MKKYIWLLPLASISMMASPTILANGAQLPQLPDYYAYAPPEPTVGARAANNFWWLKNFYISGEFGYSFADISSISNDSLPPGQNEINPPTTTTSVSDKVPHFGVALGYQLRQNGGFFSRIEIEYLNRGKLDYNANPVLAFPAIIADQVTNKLTSDVKNQTLLAKIYYDMDLHIPVIPYIQVGAGLSRNETKTDGTFGIVGEPPVTSNMKRTDTNFAWDVGAGIRLKATEHVYFQVGYEFDWLGKVRWEMATGQTTDPIILGTNNFYAHNLTARITFKA